MRVRVWSMLAWNIKLISACIVAGILFASSIAHATNITIGETNILTISDGDNANLLPAQNAVLSQPATIVSLSFYVTNASGNLRLGIYDASGPGGGPGKLRAQTNSFKAVTGWNTANVVTQVSLSAGTYWLAYLPNSNGLTFVKGITPGISTVFYNHNFGTLPATYSKSPSSDPYHWSFYASLTPILTITSLQYTVAVSASPNAGGTVSGGGTFAAGSSQTVTATANSGYSFANWTVNGSVVSTSARYTFALSGNVAPVANFTPVTTQYTVAVSAAPSAGGTVSGGGTFASGSSQTVTATANSGYSFVNWTANGSVVGTSASYTFTINGNVSLVANFKPILYTIAASASPSAGGIVVGGGTFASGSSQTVTATANGGYSFVNWTANGSVVSTSASYAFTLNSNVTLVANFAAAATQYTIAVSASPSADGKVVGAGTFPAGSSQMVTATANSGYSFVNWTANGSVVSTSASYTFTVTGNLTLVANFVASTGGSIIPAVRNFAWNPGMMSQGGIPTRTTIYATLSPSGGDDSAAIQAKLDTCPPNQVVLLNPGTFIINSSYVLVHSACSLRGSGAGVTILSKTNGAKARTLPVVSGTTGILTPVDPSTYTYDTQPVVILGPQRWPSPDNTTSQNLTADGAQGSYSITIANAGGYAAGQFVLLDELSELATAQTGTGLSWQPVPTGFGCTDNLVATPCPPYVWEGDRVVWNMHWPEQQYQDDNANSNSTGPYDTTPGVPPAAMSWFSRTDRPTTEIKQIASVSGSTITFTSPLTISYRVSHSAQLTGFTAAGSADGESGILVVNAGIENLTAIGGADGGVRFENAAYSWANGIEVTQWIGEGIAIDGSFRVQVEGSYVHTGSWPMPGGAGYMISLANGSSEILIENNIMIDACKEIVMRSSGAGSVVAYNFADDSWDADAPTWVEVGLNASHMAGPHHVLFEGNYSQNFDSDYTHGNAIYLTVFRNWLSGQRRDFTDQQNVRTVGLAAWSWNDSFVGNVLGRPGLMSGWAYTDPAMSCDSTGNNCTGNNSNWNASAPETTPGGPTGTGGGDIWVLGYDPERWGQYPEPQTLATVIRDGNYDFLTNSQRWHNTPGGFVIPNSMYLTSIPAFFGNNIWPWVNAATGTTYTLPAKARYDAGTPNTLPAAAPAAAALARRTPG